MSQIVVDSSGRWVRWLLVVMMLHSVYLLLFGDASILYVANVLLHIPAGLLVMYVATRIFRRLAGLSRAGISAIALAVLISGVVVVILGNTKDTVWIVLLHALVGFAFLGWLIIVYHRMASRQGPSLRPTSAVVVAVLALSGLSFGLLSQDRITNDILQPISMAEASMGGADGPFFPSPAETRSGNLIPSDYFTDSQSCGRSGCHVDAVEQWEMSAHRFSSFNNQWYRKSIEYMQDVVGVEPSKWCAGCHDQALLFSGMMDNPIADLLDTEEAKAGIGCVGCHGIVSVKGTTGSGGYVVEYPRMHELATSENRFIQALHDFVVRIDPAPHRETFLKDFHRDQPAEFCSSCHKVHLDSAVNNYRWVRGFNTYDNWQASGVSHNGVRSFYAPPSPQDCVTCHMQPTHSDDAGSRKGYLKAHDFAAANTALPVVNQDSVHLQNTRAFLQRNQISVDVFAAAVATQVEQGTRNEGQDGIGTLSSTFAVGEEQGSVVGAGGVTRRVDPIVGELTDGSKILQAGRTMRFDVVVRTKGVGHFFPTGTVDAQEAWLEFKVESADNEVVYWSGFMDEAGDVDPSAHFYRSVMVDGRGNLIDKRNAWAARSVIYVNLIPPGAADVAHFVVTIPEVSDELRLTAKLNYRKFPRTHSGFAFSGTTADPDSLATPDYDDRRWSFDPSSVPEIPVVTMASKSIVVHPEALPGDTAVAAAKSSARWRDYGIGLLLNGDLKGAERAFLNVADLADQQVDSWIDLARVYLQEGSFDKADKVLTAGENLGTNSQKLSYFRGIYLKSIGDYEEASKRLLAVLEKYPNDRVVLNEAGRVYFLTERFEDAIELFERVLKIDPEDLMAHYNLVLCYRAIGDSTRANSHEERYLRYKADETTQALARQYRERHPFDNNESLSVHYHGDNR